MIATTKPKSTPRGGSRPEAVREANAIPEFLCETPPLSAADERRLFQQLRRLGPPDESPQHRSRRERIRNRIVVANLRLLVSIAARFTSANRPLAEAVSDGFAPLIRSVELFDPARGNRFSTYASHAIWNDLARHGKRESARRQREPATSPEVLEAVAEADSFGGNTPDVRERLARHPETVLRPMLSQRETTMVAARFGLGKFTHEHTFREIGELLGLSRERVRVLTHRALKKLREHLEVGG